MKLLQKTVIILSSLILFLASTTFVSAATINLKLEDQSVPAKSEVVIPLKIENANKLGAMDIKLQFDSKVLQFQSAALGDLSENGMIEARAKDNQTTLISLVDSKGVTGDGSLVNVTFKVIGDEGSISKMNLEAKGYGVDLKNAPLSVTAGEITVSKAKINYLLYGAIAGGVLLLIVIGLLFLRKKKA